MISIIIEEFIKEKQTLMLHSWTEKEKLEEFAKFLAAHPWGVAVLQDLKEKHEQATADFLYEGEIK